MNTKCKDVGHAWEPDVFKEGTDYCGNDGCFALRDHDGPKAAPEPPRASLAPWSADTSEPFPLPGDYAARKGIQIFDGLLMYFPNACAEVARVSKIGNDQHNPGEPMHWARGKSMDQFNTVIRHMMDHRVSGAVDADGGYHLAKAAWRILAALQLHLEFERAQKG